MRSRTSTAAMSMSVPSTKLMLTDPSSAEAVADIVSIPLMVPRMSSRGRTMFRSVSSGDEDGYGARTQTLELEKVGRNSSGSL